MKRIFIIFIILAVGFFLFLLFEPTSCYKKVNPEDAHRHMDEYLDQIKSYLLNNYPEDFQISGARYEENYSEKHFGKTDFYSVDRFAKTDLYTGYIYSIHIGYYYGRESINITCLFNADALSEINEMINSKAISEILEMFSGYVFTEKEIKSFIDNAIDSRKKDKYHVIYDEKNIGFFSDWMMVLSVSDDFYPKDTAYIVNFDVGGYTKTGSRKRARILSEYILSICLIIILIAGSVIYKKNHKKDIDKSNYEFFDLQNEPYYLQAMKDFPSDRYLGKISTSEEAIEKAVEVWLDIYGENIYNEKPYQVFFDEKEDVWLIKGSLPKGYKGGVAYILIQKEDGKILAVWHDQ